MSATELTADGQPIAAYVGFSIPDDVSVRLESLVNRLNEGVQEHQGSLFAQVIMDLVDESMNTFFLKPVEDIGLSSMSSKLVVAGVSRVKKAVGVLVQTLSKKLKNPEMKPLANYLWSVIYPDLSKECPQDHMFMASPIAQPLNNELNSIVQDIEAGETGPQIEDRLVKALLEVSEISLDLFFAKPLAMLNLGIVMRKAGQIAFEATRAAVRGVIKKVFKGMNEQELRGVAQYIRSVKFAKERFLLAEAA
ncbi:MAG: hypothetical protein VX185_07630 [Pseudomonadota bacterium]|nr:hypothetical protein [Pseudomonadota bacterium]